MALRRAQRPSHSYARLRRCLVGKLSPCGTEDLDHCWRTLVASSSTPVMRASHEPPAIRTNFGPLVLAVQVMSQKVAENWRDEGRTGNGKSTTKNKLNG
ncbi:uncharacterized protein MYCFIDRAFT_177345 [Pseudocercospora fijiensis CIRAD86]|uniref:Uncharacterized protein n=1 Tax=Pseudocercospora fijiensis (strain CIRAD86) TaxID=383855 RepID=M3ASB6_PSEFD|nr:uncharacterized protein MYCFIDRAFT_177345 [Pseudocercospora fijiensis CIRAD86]EME80397.1 hypothetical protein MYCFIDRAFT_177345 [Pseudocercospora fijiensis CIRAD86]